MANSSSIKDKVTDKLNVLSENTQTIIEEFTGYYPEYRDNYLSAITDLFVNDIEKEDVDTVNLKDYEFIQKKHDLSKTPSAYKKTFFEFLYAYNKLKDDSGFDEYFHKNTILRRFEKRKNNKSVGHIKDEKARLTVEEIVSIENELNQCDTSTTERMILSFIWYMLFDEGCTVGELKAFESTDYYNGHIKSIKGKYYNVPQKFYKLMDKLNSRDYHGISIYVRLKKLGEYAGIDNLKPSDITIARKQNMLICCNCRKPYINSDDNWRIIENRVVCFKCADFIVKKNTNTTVKKVSSVFGNEPYHEKKEHLRFELWNENQDDELKRHLASNELKGAENEQKVRRYLEGKGYNVDKVSHAEGFDFHVYNDIDEFVVEVKTLNCDNEFYITGNEIGKLMGIRLMEIYSIYLVANGKVYVIDNASKFLQSNGICENECLFGKDYGSLKLTYDRIVVKILDVTLSELPAEDIV